MIPFVRKDHGSAPRHAAGSTANCGNDGTTAAARPTTPAHIGTALLLLATCIRSIDPLTAAPTRVPYPSAATSASPAASGAAMFSVDGMVAPHVANAYTVLQQTRAAETKPTRPRVDAGGDARNPEKPTLRAGYDAYERTSCGPASMANDAVALRGGNQDDEDDDDDEERRNKRRAGKRWAHQPYAAIVRPTTPEEAAATTPMAHMDSPAVSSATCTPRTAATEIDVSTSTSTPRAATPVAKPAKSSAPPTHSLSRFKHDDVVDVLAAAFAFLPQRDLVAARQINAAASKAAQRVVATPVPDRDDIAFVRWMPQALKTKSLDTHSVARRVHGAAKKALAATVSPNVPYRWRCLACGDLTDGNKACTACGTATSVGACRVFLGQLRKELTAELGASLVAFAAPDVTVHHVESHTNGTGTRGKGCAWAYVDSVGDARALIRAVNKRAFVDVDSDGGEGYWYMLDGDNDNSRRELQLFAEERAAATAPPPRRDTEAAASEVVADATAMSGPGVRSAATMPRQPVVAEAPANSILAAQLAAQ